MPIANVNVAVSAPQGDTTVTFRPRSSDTYGDTYAANPPPPPLKPPPVLLLVGELLDGVPSTTATPNATLPPSPGTSTALSGLAMRGPEVCTAESGVYCGAPRGHQSVASAAPAGRVVNASYERLTRAAVAAVALLALVNGSCGSVSQDSDADALGVSA